MSWEVDLANAVSRVLTIALPAKNGKLPAWVYACLALSVLVGAISARAVKKRQGELVKQQARRLEQIPLVAAMVVGDEAAKNHSLAKLEKAHAHYVLTLSHTRGAIVTEDRQQLPTLASVESYLETKTLFRLSDFKPSTQ